MIPDLPDIPGLQSPCAPTPPVPSFPDEGIAGSILPTPTNPTDGIPWTEGGPTIYEAYGLAGGQFHTYDLGCTPDPASAMSTYFANGFQSLAEVQVAVVARLGFHTYEPASWLGVFDGPLEQVSQALLDGMFSPLAPLALIVCAFAIALALRKAQVSLIASAAVFAIAAIGIAYAAANGPVKVATFADGIIPEVSSEINQAMTQGEGVTPEAAAVGPLVDDVLYPRWVQGTLGCVDCPVAQKYADDLFRATAFSWAEAEQARQDPQAYDTLLAFKNGLWTNTAEAIKAEYPSSYEHLTGRQGQDRGGAAVSAWLITLPIFLFLTMSFALICAAYLIWRGIVMTAPAWALLGLMPKTQGALSTIAMMLLAAIVNSIAYAAGVAVYVTVLAVINNPALGLNWLLSGVLSIGWTVLMWFGLRPFKRLIHTFKGDPVAHGVESMQQSGEAMKRGATAVGAYVVGRKVSDAITDEPEGQAQPTRPEGESQPYRHGPGPVETAQTTRPEGSPRELPTGDAGDVYDTSEPTQRVDLTAPPLPSPVAPGGALTARPESADGPVEGRVLSSDEPLPEDTKVIVAQDVIFDPASGYRVDASDRPEAQ